MWVQLVFWGGVLPLSAQEDPIFDRFQKLDLNKDGKLSPEELGKAPGLAARFKGADKNGDGLTIEEVRAHLGQGGSEKAEPPKEAKPLKEGPKVLAPLHAGVGRMIPDGPLNPIGGKSSTLSELTKQRSLVVVFTNTTCPICKKYGPSLTRLEKVVEDLGLGILYINPTATDTDKDIQSFLDRHQLKGPYTHDSKGLWATNFGATTTAEVFLIDQKRTVVYRGALDDQYGLGYSLESPRRTFLLDAIGAHLAGKRPDPAATTAPGCELEKSQEPLTKAAVDYHGRIERIVQNSCVECHRDGGVAPFRLDRHEDLVAHAGMIRKVVEKGTMPPWFAAKSAPSPQPTFVNDRSLPVEDKKDLLDWLSGGKPKGDPSLAPLPRDFPGGWLIGKPDLVLSFDKAVSVQATGTMPYQNVTVDTKLTEDKWIQSIEVRPGARDVVHHVLVFVLTPQNQEEGAPAPEVGSEERMGFFAVYVPGNSTLSYPEGMAKKLPKGSQLRFQMHYTPNGTATTDKTQIGMVFAKKPPVHEVKVVGLVNPRLSIPAGADNHPEVASIRIPSNATILGFLPHMHLRGKAFRYEITPPTGKAETILDIPAYDFNWQLFYRLAQPVELVSGTTIKATGWFDNSPNNPANPDPNKVVRWGPQTTDEMMLGYVEYIVPVGQSARMSLPGRLGVPGNLIQVWQNADKNRDARLSKEEFAGLFPKLPETITRGLVAEKAFERLDSNKDGFLTPDEILKARSAR